MGLSNTPFFLNHVCGNECRIFRSLLCVFLAYLIYEKARVTELGLFLSVVLLIKLDEVSKGDRIAEIVVLLSVYVSFFQVFHFHCIELN